MSTTEQIPSWQRTISLGGDLDTLRALASESPLDVATVEDTFRLIVDGLNALDPSDMPERVIRTLGNMPGEMLARFGQFCSREGLTVPEPKAHGGTVRWVIAPVI